MPVKVGLKVIEIWNDSMEKAVANYEKEPIQKGKIVFYGPSYFTRWSEKFGVTPMSEVLLGKSGAACCINRGFGSSCSEHQLYFYPRMVRPLEPKVLVYATHGNSEHFGYTREETWELAQRVIMYTLTDFPDAHVYLMGAMPQRDMDEEHIASKREYNSWVRQFAENTERCFFLDPFAYAPLHESDNFIQDGVHFTPKGYDVFGEFFKEALKDELEKF